MRRGHVPVAGRDPRRALGEEVAQLVSSGAKRPALEARMGSKIWKLVRLKLA